MALKLYSPDLNQFVDLDSGKVSEASLLLNILIELRIHSVFLQAMNPVLVSEDLNQLRADMVSEPQSITTI